MKCLLYTCVFLAPVFQTSISKYLTCKPHGKFQFNGLFKPGDIMLGAIFAVNFKAIPPELSFISKPEQWKCESFDLAVFQRAQTMVFAIEEINKDPALLPNITLGYRLYDNCVNLQEAMRAAATLIGGEEEVNDDSSCDGVPPVVAIVGDPLSTHSIAISRAVGLFKIPLVSYCATCSCLSDKQEFPTFLRTIPSDTFQVKVMAEIMNYFGWTWVGAVGTDDDYGLYALTSFNKEVKKFGCVAFSETLKTNDRARLLQVISVIKQSSAKIIVLFLTKTIMGTFIKEAVLRNITGKQWIACDLWSAYPSLASNDNFDFFGGTIGIIARRGSIPGFEKFLRDIQPTSDVKNNLYSQFWETIFQCKFKNSSVAGDGKVCTGTEDMKSIKNEYSDVSQLRASYNVYKAVYALAHALHNIVICKDREGPFENNTCADITKVQPWQLLHYLRKVNFTTLSGDQVAFDQNGDAVPILDIVNWQRAEDGGMTTKTIGFFSELDTHETQLMINKDDIFWNFESGKMPESVCSKSCQPGTRKAARKGEPVCCFDCVPCADGEINSIECIKCSTELWSNDKKNKCVLKETEFLSYDDAMGITLAATALTGFCLTVAVLAVFIHFRNTPVVKANNSELSYLLLVSLMLCFLCSLSFIGQPSHITCMLRHVVFGISFVMCISCILVKTIVVIMAFTATLPGKSTMKWFGVVQQRCTVFVFTALQALICIIWLITYPPSPTKNTKYQTAKIIFECDIGSAAGFGCLLGYIWLLAGVSFLLAFLARRLPDTFNEARFITFSMLIFCAVWITFIPAYVSSPGKHTVAVEIFAILASSFGLLFAIFAPKCYIILLKPHKNTKKSLMCRSLQKY
uniref:Extracellular calcium-sensing receptor-like n=1 Tax=Erpetoichthys calabaricus TaxID=27687 RepID=A0A8C4SFB4_ERPCA